MIYTGARPQQQPRDNQAVAADLAAQGFAYGKRSLTTCSEADKELWGIINDVPRLQGVWPYIIFVLNVVLPGVGTIIMACIGYPDKPWSKTQLVVGLH